MGPDWATLFAMTIGSRFAIGVLCLSADCVHVGMYDPLSYFRV